MSPVRRLLLGATLGIAVWVPATASPLLTCGAAAAVPAGSVAVSIVIDTGTTPASPGGTTSTCVTVPEASTGIDALQARARQLGRPGPRFNSSGLLCAIDGFPETGCGEASGADFLYWSYWVGSANQWYYANLGPGSRKVTSGTVEGWRFLQGAGRSSDQAPRATPQPCFVTPTTTASPGSPAVVAAETADRPAAGTGTAPTTVPTTVPTRSRPVTPSAGRAAATSTVPSTTTTPATTVNTPNITPSTAIDPSTARAHRTRRVESASSPSGSSGDGDGSGLLTVMGAAGVTSLAVAGWWVARRRTAR